MYIAYMQLYHSIKVDLFSARSVNFGVRANHRPSVVPKTLVKEFEMLPVRRFPWRDDKPLGRHDDKPLGSIARQLKKLWRRGQAL
jgi:hypothetical protein